MTDRPPAPGVLDALFGELPEGWRQRKGLAAAPGERTTRPAAAATGRPIGLSGDTAPAGGPPVLPGAPETPWQLSRASWITTIKRVVEEIGKDRVTAVSGGVTFFGLLALFPAITALVSIYGLVADRATILEHIEVLHRFLPPSAAQIISDQIQSIVDAPATALSVAGIVSVLVALYSANGGMKALIDALNVAWFETEKRGFIKLNLVSMAFTLGGIALIILMIGAIALVPALLNIFFAGTPLEAIVSLIRWPIMAGVLLIALAALYRWGPSKEDAAWQWISPGAVLATVGLIVASLLFSWYAANFANYNETYGSLGAAIGLMMWLWIAAIVIMVGAELNSEVERQIRIENGVEEQGHAEEESPDPNKRV